MSSVSRRSCSSNSAFFSGPSASCRFRSTQFRSFRIAFGFARHFSSGVMRPIAEPCAVESAFGNAKEGSQTTHLEVVRLVNVAVGREEVVHDHKVDLLAMRELDAVEAVEARQ